MLSHGMRGLRASAAWSAAAAPRGAGPACPGRAFSSASGKGSRSPQDELLRVARANLDEYTRSKRQGRNAEATNFMSKAVAAALKAHGDKPEATRFLLQAAAAASRDHARPVWPVGGGAAEALPLSDGVPLATRWCPVSGVVMPATSHFASIGLDPVRKLSPSSPFGIGGFDS
mmetsp:Transcript_24078/g.75739  ORF Transcript_24078/g.75739 Transcript_24078/m.75739 type:complete len:173 (-) Transcript_24078:100-618(-)